MRAREQLPRDQVAERIGWEVTDQPGCPVHILEHAVSIVGHLDPEVLLVSGVPRLGQVSDRKPPFDQLLLELEPHDDVQPVGDLVGLDADQRGCNAVDGTVKRVRVQPGWEELTIRGASTPQNGRPRPTMFSHRRLCDSCSASDSA